MIDYCDKLGPSPVTESSFLYLGEGKRELGTFLFSNISKNT